MSNRSRTSLVRPRTEGRLFACLVLFLFLLPALAGAADSLTVGANSPDVGSDSLSASFDPALSDSPVAAPSRVSGEWQPFGAFHGMEGAVFDLQEFDGGLVVTGGFHEVGPWEFPRIASWDGSEWQSLGSGLGATGLTMILFGGDLVVGGYFTTAGGDAAQHVARWDGEAWSRLAFGLSGPVCAFAVHNGELYAAGDFRYTGVQEVSHNIARWDGTSRAMPSVPACTFSGLTRKAPPRRGRSR